MIERFALILAWAAACRGPADPAPRPPVSEQKPVANAPASLEPVAIASAPPPPEPERPPPLSAPSEFIALDVPGFRPAVVSLPLGTREPRPLVVALHGNFDRPEWQCEVWRAATGASSFILCPRGVPRGDVPKSYDRWEYGSAKLTEKELDAGVAALREKFRDYLVEGPIVYVGFSLGAILGTTIVKKDAARYPRLVLIEGGLGGMEGIAKQYQEQGGERVLLACGQSTCTQKSRGLAKRFERIGLATRVVDGGNIGHTYDGAIAEGVAREWPWLVEGLEGWASAPAAPLGK